jgi:chloramphenicol 3-O-phosphotransferase
VQVFKDDFKKSQVDSFLKSIIPDHRLDASSKQELIAELADVNQSLLVEKKSLLEKTIAILDKTIFEF